MPPLTTISLVVASNTKVSKIQKVPRPVGQLLLRRRTESQQPLESGGVILSGRARMRAQKVWPTRPDVLAKRNVPVTKARGPI
jgi:hypothetical protein